MLGVDDAALAIMAAGLVSTAGTLYTNYRNLGFQDKVNDVNWQIAAMNNAAQMDMANTAHQREVRDLRAAGLNPILSAGGSGAPTPSLTSMRGDSAQIENPVAGLASSAKSLARYFGETYQTQLDQAKADVESTRLDNKVQELNARKADIELRAIDDLMSTSETVFDKSKGRYVTKVVADDINSPFFKNLQQGILNDAEVGRFMPYIDASGKVINSAGNLKSLLSRQRRRK